MKDETQTHNQHGANGKMTWNMGREQTCEVFEEDHTSTNDQLYIQNNYEESYIPSMKQAWPVWSGSPKLKRATKL